MNILFKLSPFASGVVSSSGWVPVQHNWYQIRSYCDVDFFPCVSVWAKASWRLHGFSGMSTWLRQAWRLWRGQLRSAATWVYVQQGVVCGFITVQPRHHIAGMCVEPAFQGMGIGSKLVNFAHELVGIENVDVHSLNPLARQFYERMGFQVTEVAGAYGYQYALLRMTRLLSIQSTPSKSQRSVT